jgi:hypothetical protein
MIEVDEETVTEQPVPELAGGDYLFRIVRRGDLLAVQGRSELEPAVFTFDPSRPDEEPVLVDEAWFFVPSAIEERIWLGILDPASPATVRALASVREVDVEGGITSPDVEPPDGRWPLAATSKGLLFQTDTTLDVWDPATQFVVASLPGPFPVASFDTRVVTCEVPCDTLHLIDLDRDTQREVKAPIGIEEFDGYGGAFSPDGRYVAVPSFSNEGPLDDDTVVSLALVDFESATVRVVDGGSKQGWDYPEVAWGADGRWLFFKNGKTLLAVRPDDAHALRVNVDLKGPYYGMAAS